MGLLWDRYRRYHCDQPALGMSLDISRVQFPPAFLREMASRVSAAMDAMEALEAGAVANPDEQRRVGHYWLRAPQTAPTPDLQRAIAAAQVAILEFSGRVQSGLVRGRLGQFVNLIHVGIGGSALGPRMLCEALAPRRPPIAVRFLDNIDPESIAQVLDDSALGQTLVSVVSKSGWTPTPMYVTSQLELAYRSLGFDFPRHAIATTMPGSPLDVAAARDGWLTRFPLWDWVGGRTSVTSSVGLVPAALQGIDVNDFLAGAAAMDRETRGRVVEHNPAALLALMWYWLGNGRGDRTMVVLPYRDRLASFGRYVQQLVMESIGKTHSRSGAVVNQGLTVYGGKGVTDQHSFLQQLYDGPDNCFVVFVAVDVDHESTATDFAPHDYLFASLEATRDALYDKGRQSMTIRLASLTPRTLGALVALFERAVGIYAELIDVNAYHQPAVDKGIGESVAGMQRAALAYLAGVSRQLTATQIADAIGQAAHVETIYKMMRHLAADPRRRISKAPGAVPFDERFSVE